MKLSSRPFKDKVILVVGDIIFDSYHFSKPYKVIQEAPILAYKADGETIRLGGAANVAANIAAMGATPILVGFYNPSDKNYMHIQYGKVGFLDLPEFKAGMLFPVKHRVVCEDKIIFRVDDETKEIHTISSQTDRLAALKQVVIDNFVSGVIISDYDKGFIEKNSSIIKEFSKFCKDHGVRVLADPVPQNFNLYGDVFAITPNTVEFDKIIENTPSFRHTVDEVVHTMGKNGLEIMYFDDSSGQLISKTISIPGNSINAIDVTGAGDVVSASYLLARISDFDIRSAGKIANYLAAQSVTKLGTTIISMDFTSMEL